jgi:transcriptional regulator with XRE-family HTH domain
VPSIELRNSEFRNLIADNDIRSDAEFARRAGITPGHLWRVLSGQSAPGNHFIAGTLDVLGIQSFPAVFEIVGGAAS